jgi:hypothetical protein
MVRDPVKRAQSHYSHILHFEKKNGKKMSKREDRVRLGMNNYMTWSLTADHERKSKVELVPQYDHVELAKDTLSQFDFLVELSKNSTCDEAILGLMGFEETKPIHTNTNKGKNIQKEKFTESELETMNRLDIELYKYTEKLMSADCEFFVRLHQKTINVR